MTMIDEETDDEVQAEPEAPVEASEPQPNTVAVGAAAFDPNHQAPAAPDGAPRVSFAVWAATSRIRATALRGFLSWSSTFHRGDHTITEWNALHATFSSTPVL